MGYRIHYATTYKVKYDGGTFSHSTELNDTLRDLCPDMWSNSDVADEYSDLLEIKKEDIASAIKELEVRQKELDDGTDDRPIWMQEHDYSWDHIKDFLQEALDNADKENDFVRFAWF